MSQILCASTRTRLPLLQVLRFFALWEDADSVHGETRPVTIQYFLVDDTVEIRMVHEANSGRDPFPVLMRRQMLPKKVKPGEKTLVSAVHANPKGLKNGCLLYTFCSVALKQMLLGDNKDAKTSYLFSNFGVCLHYC